MKPAVIHKIIFITAFCLASIHSIQAKRSVFRPKDPLIPSIDVGWEDNPIVHTLADYHLEEYPVFHTYDQTHFTQNLLPKGAITHRHDNDSSTEGHILNNLIQGLLDELMQPQKHQGRAMQEFENFTIIKKRDFVWRNKTGTLIVKFKKYPFVVKLFRETPEGFVNPFDKGFEPTCFFLMGGGANRHISGLTRIKNLAYVKKCLQEHPTFNTTIDFPRKWYWAPKNNRMLSITGTNIGTGKKPITTKYPSVYAVVADAIDVERSFSLTSYQDRQLALSISKYLRSYIDAHINNFVEEKGTGKTIIIDTEHFPTVVGLRRELPGKGYVGWYGRLAAKRLRDTYGRTRYARRNLQKRGPSPLALPIS